MDFNVCVIITTFNRLGKLKKALKAYEEQSLMPKYLIVVNNASTDGTKEYLDVWKETNNEVSKIIINLPYNQGGAGGFYAGEKYAMSLNDITWIMISDDDAYPERDYIYGMAKYLEDKNKKDYSIVCGKVMERGEYVNIHRTFWNSKWKWDFHKYATKDVYQKAHFEPDFVSYVGILINKEKLCQAGLVDKEFFIWNDDTEHALRLKRVGKFVCIPQYSIYHDVDQGNAQISWKSYYSYRNKTVFFKRHLKFHFLYVIFITILKAVLCPIKGKTLSEQKLRLTAIKDGVLGNLGKHPVYKPGWKP